MKRVVPFLLLACAACGDDSEPQAFALRFAAVANGVEVGCTSEMSGLGAAGTSTATLSDLRFYVGNVQLLDEDGKSVDLELDQNEFQYKSADGEVALIDLTGNTEGACANGAIAFAEGTARVNDVLKGRAAVDQVRTVRFDVGVPQKLMGAVIASTNEEGAPSPLGEMYWSWASGYRHFVMNLAVGTTNGPGEGYVHLGSRDCGSAGQKALTDRERCGFVNTPAVELAVDGLAGRVVDLDIPTILAGLAFSSPVMDMETMEMLGEEPGIGCHSGPTQADCGPVFASFGLDLATGTADASADQVFSIR